MPTMFETQQLPVVFTPNDGAGTTWPNSSVQVNVHGGGAASIFADPGLSQALANPIKPTADGYVRFYVAPGIYDLVATNFNGQTQTFTLTTTQPPALASPFTKRASTGPAGVALINGTQTILSYTAPNDGQLHPYVIGGEVTVATAETGGTLQAVFANPTIAGTTVAPGTSGAGSYQFTVQPGVPAGVLLPGQTININQTTAMTAGVASCACEIWSA